MTKKAINQEVLDKWEESHKKEIIAVKLLGEDIGYGNMMSIASALWQLSLKEKYNLDSGAFIPTIEMDMKPEEGKKSVKEQKSRMERFERILKK